MYWLLIILHVIICVALIAVILLQAGRGGGLTEAFGGDTAQSILGTQAPAILKRATEVTAIAFLVTSLALGMVTARRGRSLMERAQFPAGGVVDRGMPVLPAATIPEEPSAEVPEAQETEAAPAAEGV